MKLEYKALCQYMQTILPLLDHNISVGEQFRGRKKEGHSNIHLKAEKAYPVYINHTNRLKTLIRNCKDMAELKRETDKYVKKYMRPIKPGLLKTSIQKMSTYNRKPATIQAIQHGGDATATENWAKQVSGQEHAPDFEFEGGNDSVNVTVNGEKVSVQANDAYITYGDSKFGVQGKEEFEANWELASESAASASTTEAATKSEGAE